MEPGGILTRLDPLLDLQHAWLAGYPYTRDPALTPPGRFVVLIPYSPPWRRTMAGCWWWIAK